MSTTRANHCTTAATETPATSQQSLVTSIKCKSSYSNKYDKLTSTILNSDSTRVSCAVAVCDWSSALCIYNTQVIRRAMNDAIQVEWNKKMEIQSRNTSLTMTLQLPVTNIFDLPLIARLPWSSDDMPDCSVWTESHSQQLCLSWQPLQYTALDTGCTPLLHCPSPFSLPPCIRQ